MKKLLAATATPLASIFGSGFLVIAPILNGAVGKLRERRERMPLSLVKNLIHLVYSTKHRKPWNPKDVGERLFADQAGIFRQWDSPALVIGGVEDHVHALSSLSENYALKKIVEEVKKGGSKWMKTDDSAGKKEFQ